MPPKVERFEDLIVWQMARNITNASYAVVRSMSVRDYGFCDQFCRAALSIMNNIAEGYERGSNKDFAKFLFIARGSCGEVRSMLYIAQDQGYVDAARFTELSGQCRQCSAAIWGLIKSVTRASSWTEKVQLIPILLLALFK